MPHIDDPYSDEMLASARKHIESAHVNALSIVEDCYEHLCKQLAGAEYGVGTADEAAFALSARVLEMSAMSLLCLRSGSVPAAKILIRAALEASYKVCAIKIEPTNVEQFVNDDIAARLLLNKKIHEYKKEKGAKSIAKGIEKKIDDLTAQKAKKIDPSEWAVRAEMVDFHRLFYPWLSSDTHGNAAAIDHYFDPAREYALEIGPSDADLPMTAMILSRCLVVILRTLNAAPDEKSNAWHASIEQRLMSLEAK
jgi:hypothetical protein